MAENNKTTEGVFGTKISSDTILQLQNRVNIHSKPNKSNKELLYTNSNTPWVLLRSGVNTPGQEGNTSNELAKRFILAGGTLYAGGDTEASFLQSSGVSPFSKRPMYSKGATGFKPKPGITSIDVKTKDTWGCIMEATVHFTVWSVEDLNAIDQLYFKPGMTALLEWGHSICVNNKGNIKAVEAASTVIPNDFFFGEGKTFKEIDDALQERRESSDGNYEGIYGYVINFSYAFQKNGGYDCTVKMVSKGTVIEGLTINRAITDNKENSKAIGSVYHQILEDLNDSRYKQNNLNEFYSNSVPFYVRSVKYNGDQVNLFYVRLGGLLQIINKLGSAEISCKAKDGKTETIQGNCSVKFNAEIEEQYQQYVRFKDEFSINPYVAILPKSSVEITYGKDNWKIPNIVTGSTVSSKGDYYIADILINYNYFIDLINQVVSDKTDSFNISEVLRTLLENVQKSFGNINDFDLHYNIVTDEWSVIDRNCPGEGTKDTYPQINMSGIGAVIRDLNINSEISPEIISEMTIAATAPASPDGKTKVRSSLINWNEGCVNRHRVSLDDISQGKKKVEEEEIGDLGIWYTPKDFINFMNKAQELYSKFTSNTSKREAGDDKSLGDASESMYGELQVPAENIYPKFVNKEIAENTSNYRGPLQSGIIPVKLSFTVEGISRFNIGTSFMITPGLLPAKYDDWGYIITGVENKVDRQGWTTTVRTQYYPIYRKTALNGNSSKSKGIAAENKAPKYSFPQNSKYAVTKLVSCGVPTTDAIGIVANLVQESRLNPAAVGDFGTSFGIAQWHIGGEAEAMMKAFNLSTASEITSLSLDEQLSYVSQIAKTRGLVGASTPEAAAITWCIKYERPASSYLRSEERARMAAQLASEMGIK